MKTSMMKINRFVRGTIDQKHLIIGMKKILKTIDLIDDKSTYYYTYINNEEFTVRRKSKRSGNIKIMRYAPQREEVLTLNAQGDTN